jgi:hypothetical protein
MLRKEVINHWSQYVPNMTQTPQEFYAAIEALIAHHEIPDLKMKRVKYFEKGLLSAKREYLQIRGHNHFFDVCAAPYGKGFFVSYWQRENLSSKVKLLSKIPIPKIAMLTSWWASTTTFYMADSIQMFLNLVHTSIVTALDKELTTKGLKGLSESQRQLPQTYR